MEDKDRTSSTFPLRPCDRFACDSLHVGYYTTPERNRSNPRKVFQRFQLWGSACSLSSSLSFFVSRRGAENAEALWRCNPPPFPHETCGIGSLGMGCGTPLPVAVQATMWNRRMRNLPTATRGTDARPMTISARKSSLAHISCVGLRHPSERRDSTPVSKTCHST